jgi:hypothetical protein
MLSGFRRWSRLLAVLLLLASGRLPHVAADDAACVPGSAEAAAHDETRHAYRDGSVAHTDHCAVCHWARSLRAPGGASAAAAIEVRPESSVVALAAHPPQGPFLEGLAARAPPARL